MHTTIVTLLGGLFCLYLLNGCGRREFQDQLIVEILSVQPASPFAGDDATFTATATSGTAPYTYAWDLGGAAEPNTASETTAAMQVSLTRTLRSSPNQQAYTVRLTVTDANGATAAATLAISVRGVIHGDPPPIHSAVYNAAARTLTVTVSDPDDGATLTVTVTPSAGLVVDARTKTASATGPLTAVFHVSAEDILQGAAGTLAVSASDGDNDWPLATTIAVSIPGVRAPADTLLAVPMVASAAVGAPVRVAVVQGPTANPFQYMVGAGLTIESDASFVQSTFDIGAPDNLPDIGRVEPVDGVWANMGPVTFMFGEQFLVAHDIGGGRERWDFSVSPLGGVDLAGPDSAGVLFNAEFTFSSPGTKTFGFMQSEQGVKRTFYADGLGEYYWGDISNDGSVAPNSVTIN